MANEMPSLRVQPLAVSHTDLLIEFFSSASYVCIGRRREGEGEAEEEGRE